MNRTRNAKVLERSKNAAEEYGYFADHDLYLQIKNRASITRDPQIYDPNKNGKKNNTRNKTILERQTTTFETNKGLINYTKTTSRLKPVPFINRNWPNLTKLKANKHDILTILEVVLNNDEACFCIQEEALHELKHIHLREKTPTFYLDSLRFLSHSLFTQIQYSIAPIYKYDFCNKTVPCMKHAMLTYLKPLFKHKKVNTNKLFKTLNRYDIYINDLQNLMFTYLDSDITTNREIGVFNGNNSAGIGIDDISMTEQQKGSIRNEYEVKYKTVRYKNNLKFKHRVVAAKTKQAAANRIRLQQTRTVRYSDVLQFVSTMKQYVYKQTTNYDNPKIDDNNIHYALALLQISYGSRFVGVAFNNTIESIQYTPLETIKNIVTSVNNKSDLSNFFGGMSHVVWVCNLSKDQSKGSKLIKEYVKNHNIKDIDNIDFDDIDIEDMYDKMNEPVRCTTRPIIWQFFVSDSTDVSKIVDVEQAVKNFLKLFKNTRLYLAKTHPEIQKLKWENNNVNANNDDSHKYIHPREMSFTAVNKNIRAKLYNRTKKVVHTHLQHITMNNQEQKSRGTHDLRRLYAALAYRSFAPNNMLQAEFTRLVLAHKDHNTSLRYMTLRVTDADNFLDPNKLEYINQQFSSYKQYVTNEIASLKKLLDTTYIEHQQYSRKKDYIRLTNNAGDAVWIQKLERAQRGTSQQHKIERSKQKITELKEKKCPVNVSLLRKLNVNSTLASQILKSYSGNSGFERPAKKRKTHATSSKSQLSLTNLHV